MRAADFMLALVLFGGCKSSSRGTPVGDWVCEGKPGEEAHVSTLGKEYRWRARNRIFMGEFDGQTLQMGSGLNAFAVSYDRDNDLLVCVAGCDCAKYVRGAQQDKESAGEKEALGKLILEQLPENLQAFYCRIELSPYQDRYYPSSGTYVTGGPSLRPCATRLLSKGLIVRQPDKREDPTAAPYRFQLRFDHQRVYSLIRSRLYYSEVEAEIGCMKPERVNVVSVAGSEVNVDVTYVPGWQGKAIIDECEPEKYHLVTPEGKTVGMRGLRHRAVRNLTRAMVATVVDGKVTRVETEP